MPLYRADVFRVIMRGPADVSGMLRLFGERRLDPQHIVAVLGKTEGNGGVNDFTREYAHGVFARTLAEQLDLTIAQIEARIAIIMSGGTEGVLSPHATIFARVPVTDGVMHGKRLAIGIARTRDFAAEELGRHAQIAATAEAVRAAVTDAGISDPADVHFVQIKCPLLTAARVQEAALRGAATVTDDAYASMGYSRGASALGTALALGEIAGPIGDDAVLSDWRLASSVASASAGIEMRCNVVIVIGNAASVPGELRVAHSVMRDAIDVAGAARAFRDAGIELTLDPMHASSASDRVVNVFAKAEAAPDGMIRGLRHTMLDDTDISATRHARAAVGGLLAGLAGSGAIYVSGGAEHQGPPGGGPVAVIAKV